MFPLAVPYGWSAELCEEAMKEKAPLLYKEFCEARFIFVKHLARFHRQSRAPSDEVTLVTMGRHAQRGFAAISRRVGIASSGAMAHICALLDHRIIMGEPWYQETFIHVSLGAGNFSRRFAGRDGKAGSGRNIGGATAEARDAQAIRLNLTGFGGDYMTDFQLAGRFGGNETAAQLAG
eukprot:CAMPEP_0172601140 /NCGR_PEP_ID=MMETSP1068-20121228/21297_1 /TAXON_ID=35684 /ORGANISM="Pseudopedinella elastica, Strain CCMP716" /LENGTH=177 /DNA_ID=CAMNT_0013402027 /DNA_START=489 /DNA_END=1019 /DNA_ORIENTATION=-